MGRPSPQRAHPHHVLTARTVAAANAPGRICDGNGLYLLVKPSGAKSWVLRTVVNGTSREFGLGSVRLVRLAEAREEAQRLRKIARDGGDPLAERQRPAMPTFADAAQQYHATIAPTFKNVKHRQQWLSSLGPCLAACGAKRVDAVTTADLIAAITPRWLTHQETSDRVVQRVRAIFEWCAAKGYCTATNPTYGLTKVLPKRSKVVRHHPALPYRDVPAFLRALPQSDAGVLAQLALAFLVLSCTRTQELLGARWEEIDLATRTWTVPASRMKRRVEHRVPLSSPCLAILAQAQTVSMGSPYVFPNPRTQQPFSNMAFLMVTRRLTAQRVFVPSQPYVPHGFRSSYRDWAEEQTHVAHAVKEAVLAHQTKSHTEAAYNRTDLFEQRRDLMEAWAGFATATPATVLAFRA
ncbi:MAG: integrase arm-type DNA-binding domain-containing protein [Acidobacteria bacterium]|nr:integrase arm-type DNA-binding domain-containing protein [Acidobacteriota bacterium]